MLIEAMQPRHPWCLLPVRQENLRLSWNKILLWLVMSRTLNKYSLWPTKLSKYKTRNNNWKQTHVYKFLFFKFCQTFSVWYFSWGCTPTLVRLSFHTTLFHRLCGFEYPGSTGLSLFLIWCEASFRFELAGMFISQKSQTISSKEN